MYRRLGLTMVGGRGWAETLRSGAFDALGLRREPVRIQSSGVDPLGMVRARVAKAPQVSASAGARRRDPPASIGNL